MQLHVFDDEALLAKASVEAFIEMVAKKPDALVCIAAGHTQIKMLELLCQAQKNKEVDLSRIRIVGLDEWIGLDEKDEGSCQHFLTTYFYSGAGILPEQITRFNAKASDLEAECKKINDYLDCNGPIDLLFLGVGMNGHVGFNEPFSDPTSRAYARVLDTTSVTVGQKYFSTPQKLEKGITIGLKDLLQAREVIIQVTGAHKAQVVKDFLTHNQDVQYPVSLFLDKDNARVFLDKDAAALV